MKEEDQPALREVIREEKTPGTQPGQSNAFNWNLVGWFGASLGAALWMIATPFFLNWPTKGVFAGIVGTLLIWSYSSLAWGLRAKIPPFRGWVGLLASTVLANLGFLLFAHAHNLPLDEASDAIETNYGLYYGALLALFISLLVYFWFKENRSEPRKQ